MGNDNNPFELKVQGHIENGGAPKSMDNTQLLEEATKLIGKLQDELKGIRTRLVEQEAELRDLREELNKPTGS